MKKQSYFQHDDTAKDDEKIIDLRAEMGWEGYGLYWALIEWMHQQGGTIEYKPLRMAVYLSTTEDKIRLLVQGFLLFRIEDDMLVSRRLSSQLEYREQVRQQRSRAGQSRHKVSTSSANAQERKGKESKGKKSKVLVIPTEVEVMDYFREKGYRPDVGSKAWEYYEANDWKDSSGKPVKAWKQKMIAVWFRDEHRIGTQDSDNIVDMAKHIFNG